MNAFITCIRNIINSYFGSFVWYQFYKTIAFIFSACETGCNKCSLNSDSIVTCKECNTGYILFDNVCTCKWCCYWIIIENLQKFWELCYLSKLIKFVSVIWNSLITIYVLINLSTEVNILIFSRIFIRKSALDTI